MKSHVELLERRAIWLRWSGRLLRFVVSVAAVGMAVLAFDGIFSGWLLLVFIPLWVSAELLVSSGDGAASSAYQLRMLYSSYRANQPSRAGESLAPSAPEPDRLVWEPVGGRRIPPGRNGTF